jgi:hypothetical protein
MRLIGFLVMLAVAGLAIAWVSGWNPLLPKDYEECAERAAQSAKSKEALAILVSSCSSKFVGRRNPRGGYSYYDVRQNLAFSIVGPNPTADEWAFIEKRYAQFLADVAAADEAKRRQDAELQRMQVEAQRQAAIVQADQTRKLQLAQADLERRRQTALSRIAVTSTDIICLYPALDGCSSYKLTTSVKNQSSETISTLFIGWAFIAEGETCPTSVQTKSQEQVRFRPGDTLVLNINERFDGPATKQFRYCVRVTGAQISP